MNHSEEWYCGPDQSSITSYMYILGNVTVYTYTRMLSNVTVILAYNNSLIFTNIKPIIQ